MNFKNWKYHPDNIPTEAEERSHFLKNLEKQFEDEIRENRARYDGFFDQYNPDTIDAFIVNYAKHKAMLVSCASYFYSQATKKKEIRYRDQAELMFELIKQKKLFNMQILWRAGQLKIPCIRLAVDFYYWEQKIEDCFFLEPVTRAELEAMKLFLKSSNYTENTQSWLSGWQDYDEIMEKDADDDFDYMPEWYDFYDGMMGTGYLLSLPDLYGQKHDFYYSLVRQYNQAEQEKKQVSPIAPHVRRLPTLWAHNDDTMRSFISMFDDETFSLLEDGYHRNSDESKKYTFEEEELNEALEILKESNEPVVMPGGLPWHEAIIKCAEQYINGIVAEEIEVIYEEYLMMESIGANNVEPDMLELMKDYRKLTHVGMVENAILQGMALNGETPDLENIF